MIFVDTSALYALLDHDDLSHIAARETWNALLDSNATLFTSNYVVVEACALLQSRLGLGAVRVFLRDMLPAIDVRWVDENLHAAAMNAMLTAGRRKLSLVDCVSFSMMRKLGITHGFAFDKHFSEEQFLFPE